MTSAGCFWCHGAVAAPFSISPAWSRHGEVSGWAAQLQEDTKAACLHVSRWHSYGNEEGCEDCTAAPLLHLGTSRDSWGSFRLVHNSCPPINKCKELQRQYVTKKSIIGNMGIHPRNSRTQSIWEHFPQHKKVEFSSLIVLGLTYTCFVSSLD